MKGTDIIRAMFPDDRIPGILLDNIDEIKAQADSLAMLLSPATYSLSSANREQYEKIDRYNTNSPEINALITDMRWRDPPLYWIVIAKEIGKRFGIWMSIHSIQARWKKNRPRNPDGSPIPPPPRSANASTEVDANDDVPEPLILQKPTPVEPVTLSDIYAKNVVPPAVEFMSHETPMMTESALPIDAEIAKEQPVIIQESAEREAGKNDEPAPELTMNDDVIHKSDAQKKFEKLVDADREAQNAAQDAAILEMLKDGELNSREIKDRVGTTWQHVVGISKTHRKEIDEARAKKAPARPVEKPIKLEISDSVPTEDIIRFLVGEGKHADEITRYLGAHGRPTPIEKVRTAVGVIKAQRRL